VPDAETAKFWLWFREKSSALRKKRGDIVADALHAALVDIHPSLRVEVADADKSQTAREVILSGSGDPIAMQRARDIVAAAPSDGAWRFVALKPAKGFDFTYADGEIEIEATCLYFEPLGSSKKPESLGLLVYCADRFAQAAQIVDVMWLIVETGIGEEAAARIATIQVAPESERSNGALPIGDLHGFLDWRRRRVAGPGAAPH